MTQQRTAVVSGLVAVGFFMVVSIAMIVTGINWWLSGVQSNSWPLADGQLIKIRLLGSTGRGNRILAEYTYTFNGTNYQGSRIGYGGAGGNEEQLSGLRDGDNIKIHVNPKNPSDAVLIPGVTSGAKVLTFFGGFVLFVTLLVSGSMWLSYRKGVFP
jgi:hypothetical protein